jgi:hypothetical protein
MLLQTQKTCSYLQEPEEQASYEPLQCVVFIITNNYKTHLQINTARYKSSQSAKCSYIRCLVAASNNGIFPTASMLAGSCHRWLATDC